MKNELTEKQKLFVEEYLIDLNAAGAARRAGYAGANSDKIGHELLGKTRVQLAIQEKIEARSRKLELNAESILREIAAIAFSSPQDSFEFASGQVTLRKDIFTDSRRSKSISGVTIGRQGVAIHFLDRLKALELLLKHVAAHPIQSDEDRETTAERISRLYARFKNNKNWNGTLYKKDETANDESNKNKPIEDK